MLKTRTSPDSVPANRVLGYRVSQDRLTILEVAPVHSTVEEVRIVPTAWTTRTAFPCFQSSQEGEGKRDRDRERRRRGTQLRPRKVEMLLHVIF